jgi:hypothetical protein
VAGRSGAAAGPGLVALRPEKEGKTIRRFAADANAYGETVELRSTVQSEARKTQTKELVDVRLLQRLSGPDRRDNFSNGRGHCVRLLQLNLRTASRYSPVNRVA